VSVLLVSKEIEIQQTVNKLRDLHAVYAATPDADGKPNSNLWTTVNQDLDLQKVMQELEGKLNSYCKQFFDDF
jgi:hypothetical protein